MIQNGPSTSTGSTTIQRGGYSPAIKARTVWALILDRRKAHFLEKDGRHFNPVKIMENLKLVYHGIDNETIGRHGAKGMGRHKYEPSMTESRQNSIAFAKEIVAWLDKERRNAHFDDVVIAASPTMLGEVMKNIEGAPLEKCVVGTASRNLMEFNGKDLEAELLKIIPGPMKV